MGTATPAPGTKMPEHTSNTTKPIRNDGEQRMPHERDQTPDAQQHPQRSIIKQAADDIEQGLVDTDRHSQPGVEQARAPGPREGVARPQPDTKRD